MPDTLILSGNEAIAQAAINAGIAGAYSYPGTPATEILERIITYQKDNRTVVASWTANEKTAYEAALGVSLTGGRALIAMKHVGLNSAADPFINSALAKINGGVVLVVADDPGMHSSQNEQDSRHYADFARIICLEPSCQQEAYTMTRQAFLLSEICHIPVMIRLVTRIAHGRSNVQIKKEINKKLHPPRMQQPGEWVLLPSISRSLWSDLIVQQQQFITLSDESEFNKLHIPPTHSDTAIITTGIARQYYLENANELPSPPVHLHIGMYPLPENKIRTLVEQCSSILVIEEGYPFVERFLRGLLPQPVTVHGRMDATLPVTGELSPDSVRSALGLSSNKEIPLFLQIPDRPPSFCNACPHIDSLAVIKETVMGYSQPMIASDIGCYTLGALPPYSVLDSTICMGASIGMAIGAADNGTWPSIAVIGDSTFLHSGIQALCDARSKNSNITIIILDNEVVAMTGGQDTIIPSHDIKQLIIGCGVDPAHVYTLETDKQHRIENISLLKHEIDYKGLSVVIMHRGCVMALQRRKRRNH